MPTGRGCKVTPVDHVETESKRGGGDEDVEREGKTSLRYSFAIVLSCRGDRPGVTKSAGEEEIKTIVPDISVIEKHLRVIQSLQRAGEQLFTLDYQRAFARKETQSGRLAYPRREAGAGASTVHGTQGSRMCNHRTSSCAPW